MSFWLKEKSSVLNIQETLMSHPILLECPNFLISDGFTNVDIL